MAIQLAAARLGAFFARDSRAVGAPVLAPRCRRPRCAPAPSDDARRGRVERSAPRSAARTLFHQLGGFVGGCTLEAIEAVSATNPWAALSALVEGNLLQLAADRAGARYTMLEPIREYALRRRCGSPATPPRSPPPTLRGSAHSPANRRPHWAVRPRARSCNAWMTTCPTSVWPRPVSPGGDERERHVP